MKSFDLTFSGAVLPGHDPGQVKEDFAQMFSIDDSALLDRIFSGQTIILRHNLDRKTAADYFRKITLLGGQASLINTPNLRSVRGDEILVLEPQPDGRPDEEPGAEPEPIPAEPLPELPPELPQDPEPEPVTPMAVCDKGDKEEPHRLEALERAKRKARKTETRLLRQKEQHDRIASEEIEKIEQLQRENRVDLEQKVADLRAAAEEQAEALATRMETIEEKKEACADHARRALFHLDDLMAQKRKENSELSNMIGQRMESTRESSLEEIRRLEQLIEDVQLRAEAELAELEQQLQDVRTRSGAEIAALQEQKDETLHSRDDEIEQLEEDVRTARAQSESERSELEAAEQQLRAIEKEESQSLDAMKTDIEIRREQGIAEVVQELMYVRERTSEILEELGADSPAASGGQDGSWASRKEAG